MRKPKQATEIEPDAWQRFERAVDAVVKSPPQPRVKKAKPKSRKRSGKHKKKSG